MLAAGLLVNLVLAPLVLGRNVPRSELLPRSQLASIPSGFSINTRALVLDDHTLRLTIGFPSSNADALHATLLDVSDPSSPNYGQHLSKDEVSRLAFPRPDSVKAITDWLGGHGLSVESRSYSGETLTVRVPVAQANAILAANFTAYTHDTTNTTMIRTLSYSLPANLHDHVAFVYPTTQFDAPVRLRAAVDSLGSPIRRSLLPPRADSASAVPASCASSIDPGCLQALYGIPTTPATSSDNSLYVSGLGGESANPNDLQTFLTQFRPDIKHGSYASLSVAGSSDPGMPSDEGNCDTQYTVGLATNVSVTYTVAGNKSDGVTLGDLLNTVEYLLELDQPPLVVTTSYVFDEPDNYESIQLALTLCNYYAQLGLRGTSVIFASGDGGAVGGVSDANNGCHLAPFVPSFPSTCPFVTSVGSTQGINPEVAANFSSGGFSHIFSRPSYQDHAVNSFLQKQGTGTANAAQYNVSGRAYPDVATQGAKFNIHSSGQAYEFTGTSASSPTFASVIALVNDRLLVAGKSPLGFLNPLLYSNASVAFNDITSGDNRDPVCGAGFNAEVGWDAVTGLGTPDFNKLLNVVTGRAVNEHLQSSAAHGLWIPRLMYTFLWTFAAGLLRGTLM